MNIHNLMIGDWVNFLIDVEGGDTEYDGETAYYQPLQITTIAAWGVGNDGEVASDEGVVNDPGQLQPIPLTAEILLKNGWRKPPIDYDKEARSEFWTCDCDWIIWEHHGFMLCHKEDFVGWGIELTYVHELQHALRSCNIDKKIETMTKKEIAKNATVKKQGEKLDADKVIAWLVANICDFEYYVKRFKKDFKL